MWDRIHQRGVIAAFISVVVDLATLLTAQAVEPEITAVNLRGLQTGSTTTLVIDGSGLEGSPQLLLPFPANVQLAAGATLKRASFAIKLGDDVIPGYYQLRVTTDGGVSLPVILAVDHLLPQPLGKEPVTLPLAMHGVVGGSNTVEAKFSGKAQQHFLAEIESQRLGGKLRPVLHLYGPDGLQLAWSWPTAALFGDTRLEAMLPSDGQYTVALHDAEYAAASPSFFRLRLGEWSQVDQVFPPAIAPGQADSLEWLGVGANAGGTFKPTPCSLSGPQPLAWPPGTAWSGPRPTVLVSAHREVQEQTASAEQQLLPTELLGVSGKLLAPYEEDRYRLAVVPELKLRLNVVAERLGSPVDVALVIRNEKGDIVARSEDSPGTIDPTLDYAVPAGMTTLTIGIVDALGRGGPRGIYRLIVDPQTKPQADFALTTTQQRLQIPAAGAVVLPIQIERRGYAGPVELAMSPLPAGVQLENTTIPAGADGAIVVVRRSEAPFPAAITTWQGRAVDGSERSVCIKGHPLQRLQPWLASEIAVAGTIANQSDFQIDWRDLPTEPEISLRPGQKLALPFKLVRADEMVAVRISLLSSQTVPLVNGQPVAAQTIRVEKAVEVGAKVNEGEVSVVVPTDLPSDRYDLTLQAELLSANKQTVVATAFAPVRRMPVLLPISIELAGPARFDVSPEPGKPTIVKITGKVLRQPGVAGDVPLRLLGLPAAARTDNPTVKADQSEFALTVTLPPNTPTGEMKDLKLSGAIAPDPKQPAQLVRSRDIDLTLAVLAAKPPAQ